MIALIRSEATKLRTARSTWILGLVSILGTWPLAWLNAASAVGISSDDPRLFAAEPVPLAYQGFEMAGLGYVLVVALAALWAGSEYGSGRQVRSTLLATPQRLRVFLVKALLLAVTVAAIAFLTMTGAIVITHIAGQTGVDPWVLSPAIWANLGGVTLAWTLTALVTFAIGVLARTAILPLILNHAAGDRCRGSARRTVARREVPAGCGGSRAVQRPGAGNFSGTVTRRGAADILGGGAACCCGGRRHPAGCVVADDEACRSRRTHQDTHPA